MAKRASPKKRRDRRSGQSPYARYSKTETIYSPQYYAWYREATGKAHRMDLGRRGISSASSKMAA